MVSVPCALSLFCATCGFLLTRKRIISLHVYLVTLLLSNVYISVLSFTILLYYRLCPSTAGNSPLPESSNFLRLLLSLFIPLPVVPQCHLPIYVLVFRLILYPLSATVHQIVHLLSFIQVMCPAHIHFVLVTCWNSVCHCGFFFLPNDSITYAVFYIS